MRSQEDGAIVMFGGTGTYTDENYSFHETLQLADFWFAWLWLFPSLTQRMVYLTFFPVRRRILQTLSTTTSTISESGFTNLSHSIVIPNDGAGEATTLGWNLVPALGADDPLANTTSNPPLQMDRPRGRSGAQAWTTLGTDEQGNPVQHLWLFGGEVRVFLVSCPD